MASMEESSVKTDGQLWSVWAENIGYKTEENEDDGTEEEKKKRESDAMKLRQEDMPLFGFCPAWDDFYLVVCELCSRVIKPQALKNHIELRHGNSTLARGERHEAIGQHAKAGNSNKGGSSSCQMALGRTSSVSHSVKSNSPSHPPSRSHTKPGSSHCHGNPSSLQLSSSHNAVTSSKSKPENSSRLKKNSMAPFVRVERMPDDILKTTSVHAVNSLSTDKKELPSPQQPPPPNLNISSLLLNISGPTTTASTITITTTTTTATTGQSFPSQSQTSCFPRTLNSGPSENCSMPLTQMGADSVSSDAKRQSTSSKNKKVPKERKLLLCKDREYDPNKHCGVKVAETGKPCTRSLTCKTHSLSLRRAVVGRKKNFDELLQDHRAAKEAAQKASQSQASGATQHQTNDSCQISHGISESVGIPNASTISSKPGSGTKSSGTSSAGLIKSANKQMLKHNKHASTKAISPAIPVNRPSSHNVEPSKPPSLLPENQLQQRLQESAAEPSAPKLTPQDTRYITHHPRPSAICTFGLRQLGNGLFLLDRRWDLPRAAFRAAVCTERANHPPPLKKLCIESKLPPVPEPVDPNDPYSFTCSEPSSSQPSRNSSSVIGDIKTVVSTSLHSNLARSAVTVNSKSCLSNSSVSTGPKSFQSKPVSNKVKVREKTVNVSRNGSGGGSNPAKKKRNTAPSSGSTSGSSVNRTSNMSFPATTGGVALTTQTLPLLPLTIGDHLGALSQLQVSTHLVANRNNLTISPAVIRSQGMATIQSATSGRGTKDGTSVVVTGVDVLNGQLPVPSALLHSVTVSRPCGAMPTLLATSGGLGITVGTTGLVGQLSHIQKTANTSESELTTPVLNSSKGSNKKANAVASVGVPNSNLTTTCTAGSTWSSAKAKAKIRKPSSGKSVILNHTTAVTHISGVGLLLESGGNVSANNGGINNHTSPQMLSSPSATPSPLLRSDSVSPQVPVSSPLHNGLGPSPPPPPFLSQKGLGSNASGTNIVNHTASVSPASRTSTPSPSTDLSSPGSTGSGPKGKSSGRHSGNIQKIAAAATSGSGHGTFHLSMPPPVSVSALPVVTSGTMSSSSLSYQQVFTKQMLTNDQLTQLQIQTVGKHNTKSTTASSRPSSLTLATAAMPLYPGLLTASGIVPTTSSSSLRQQQRPLLLQNEESRRTAVQMQGSPSLPT